MWDIEVAKKIKEGAQKARDHAVSDASAYLGQIETVSPLKISILDGQAYYEDKEDEILLTDVAKYSLDKLGAKAKGLACIVVPVNSLDIVAVIDVMSGDTIKALEKRVKALENR